MAFKIFSVIRARFFNTVSDTALDIGLNGETNPKLSIDAGGKIAWGAGDTSTVDTNLYRDSANVLKTDDTFKASALFVDNIEIDTTGASASQFLQYDGTKFVPTTVVFGSSDVESLDDLLDVNLTTPSVNQVLKYDGTFWINASVSAEVSTLDSLTDVVIASAANGQLLQYDGTNWVNSVLPTQEPMGHEDATQSSVSFNNATRVFTISPTGASFTIWCKGKRFIKSTSQTVTIPNTTGLYYIYFDSTGTLQYRTTYFDWDDDCMTAYVYWNSSTSQAEFFADERHGITLDWQTHEYLHRTRGAVIASGFGATNYVVDGDGSSDAHAKLDIANGTFFDEDMEIDIVHDATPASNSWEQVLEGNAEIPVFYLSGTAWRKDAATEFPLKQGTSRPQYNSYSAPNWSATDIADNKFGISWIIATNNLNSPVITVLGQASYNTVGDAEAATWDELDLTGFPVFEFRPLYKLIYQCNDTYTNSVNARFVGVYDLRRVTSAGESIPATPVSDHGSMTGLGDDDHSQYVHLSVARTITASHTFTNGLSSSGPITASQLTVSSGAALGLFDIVETALTTTSANQQLDSTQGSAIKYMVRADDGTNADSTEIMALLDGSTVNFVEYGRVGTSASDLAEYSFAQSSGNIILRATPASSNTTFHIIKTVINA